MALSKRARVRRREFRQKYSSRTAKIVKLYALKRHLDWRSREIGERLDVNKMTVAATLANLTRGTYFPFANVDFYGGLTGECRF